MYIVYVLEFVYYFIGNVYIEKYEEIYNCCYYSMFKVIFAFVIFILLWL